MMSCMRSWKSPVAGRSPPWRVSANDRAKLYSTGSVAGCLPAPPGRYNGSPKVPVKNAARKSKGAESGDSRVSVHTPPASLPHRVQARHAAGVVVMLGVRAGLRVNADDRQAVGCLGDRNLDALQQKLPVQSPFEPATHLWAVPGRAGGYRLVARKPGLHDPLTDEEVKACQRVRPVPGHDDHSALTSRP